MPDRPLQTRAKSLRTAQTPAERAVWKILKAAPFDDWHFRRQVPFGSRYIADFVSHRARVVIEIDGDTHDLEAEKEMARTAWLETQGYRVIRFTNAQVTEWRLVERTLMAALGIG
ncbi:MAG: endonuclease domain-containing protein [Polymorphobacter sp.]